MPSAHMINRTTNIVQSIAIPSYHVVASGMPEVKSLQGNVKPASGNGTRRLHVENLRMPVRLFSSLRLVFRPAAPLHECPFQANSVSNRGRPAPTTSRLGPSFSP